MEKKDASYIHIKKTLGYSFKNLKLLKESLVHKSYANEMKGEHFPHNERLEYLGDTVLELIVSDLLMKRFPHYTEGDLSKMRAVVVNESTLAQVAIKLDLGKFVYLGRGEERSRGRLKASILADTYEALLAAMYRDGGFEAVYNIVQQHFKSIIEAAAATGLDRDYKTRLQEEIQARYKKVPQYVVTKETGPDHNKIFQVKVIVQNEILALGSGKSKKEADQDAARNGLKILKEGDTL